MGELPQLVLKDLFSWFRKVYNVHILQSVLVFVAAPLYSMLYGGNTFISILMCLHRWQDPYYTYHLLRQCSVVQFFLYFCIFQR